MLTSPKVVIVSVTMVMILSSVAFAPVRGRDITLNWTTDDSTSGSGTAGSGSIAVSAFFDISASSGAGGFAGDLNAQNSQHAIEGIFSLTTPNPASMPVLPCGPAGDVGASGVVISGVLQGDPVTVFSCVGNDVTGGVQIVDRLDPFKSFAYSGIGTGDGSTSQSPALSAAVVAGNTVGGGSAGTGSIAIAETLVALLVNRQVQLQGGGAFVGTLNAAIPVGGTFITKTASIGNGCETNIAGVVSSGLFLGQPETTSFLPFQCQPTFQQQGRLLLDGIVSFTIGTPSNPVYIGKGTGQAFLIPRVGQEVIV